MDSYNQKRLGQRFVLVTLFLATWRAWGAPGDENWDDRFTQPLLGPGQVTCMAARGHEVFVAGRFFSAGGVAATNVARWDGSRWSALGEGLSLPVSRLAVSGTNLYAAGPFPTRGGSNGPPLLCWNGATWTPVETGLWLASEVVSFGGGLCLAGLGTNLAGEVGGALVLLEGTNRNVLAFQTNASFICLAVRGKELFMGGSFDSIAGVAATNLARWDGTNWSAVGGGLGTCSGLVRPVMALAADDHWLYAGGVFANAGELSLTNLARWDGTNWSGMESGLAFPTNGGIAALAVGGGRLYASGIFGPGQPARGHNLARWDGAHWTVIPIANGVHPVLAADATDLYVGGDFGWMGGRAVNGLARWDGTEWSALADGLTDLGRIASLAVQDDAVVVGGRFHTLGGITAWNMARWDGTRWSALGEGADGPISQLLAAGPRIYAIGSFNTIGGIAAAGQARFDGTNWAALSGGEDFAPTCLVVQDTNLFAGGHAVVPEGTLFGGVQPVGPPPFSGGKGSLLCRWTGHEWQPMLGRDFGWRVDLAGLAADATRLYVVGTFSRYDSNAPDTIDLNTLAARLAWDGTNWSPEMLTGGTSGFLQAVSTSGDLVCMATGSIAPPPPTLIPVTPVIPPSNLPSIPMPKGSSEPAMGIWLKSRVGTNWWDSTRSGFASVSALTVADGNVFLIGDPDAGGIIKWDGVQWQHLGSGISSPVSAVASRGREVFVGGQFTKAGGKPAQGFAVWHEPLPEPRLGISQRQSSSTHTFLISWPAVFTNTVLEETSQLAPGNWSAVQQEPAHWGSHQVVSNTFTVSLPWPSRDGEPPPAPAVPTNRFYRLRPR